jgi:hypothetical protein
MNIVRLLSIVILLLISTYQSMLAIERLDFDQAFEAIYAQRAEQVDQETLYENLWAFYQNPLNINQANREDLEQIFILSDTQINQLFAHLNKNGPLVSIYELQVIPEFDLSTIYQLLPFIKIPETYPQHRLELSKWGIKSQQKGYWISRYERTLETKQGYKFHHKKGIIPYVGSPDKIFTRIKYSHPQGWTLGIAGKKNPGEAFTWDPTTSRYGFDVYAAYLLFQNKGYLKQLVLGDYQIGYGQGLIVNAGTSLDKSSDAIPIMRTKNLGIKPHSSPSSSGMRGSAATFTWKQWTQTIYYAYNQLDAHIIKDKSTNEPYVKSVQRNNLYRTQTALSKRGQVSEQVIGTTLIYQRKDQDLEIGLNTLYHLYNLSVQPDPIKYVWGFRGKENYNIGLFYRYLWYNIHFFGEGAMAKSGGKAMLTGLVASLSSTTDISLLFRNYDKDFHNPYGQAFKENSKGNSNEQGLYIGFKVQPIKKLIFHAYCDYFKFPEPSNHIPEPSTGYDWLAKSTYQPSRSTLFRLQYQEAHKAKKVPKPSSPKSKGKNPLIKKGQKRRQQFQPKSKGKNPLVKKGQKRRLKAQLKYVLSRRLDLTTDGQWSRYQLIDQPTWGYGVSQSATYKLRQLSITGQVAWFDADYVNRLFFYEKEVLYTSTMPPAYYQTGMKYCLFLAYKPHPSWRFEIKYACTWLKDQASIGNGLERIEGNIKNEIKLQVMYKF